MISAVVLAAGAGSRFGGPKQLVLLPAVLEQLRRSPVDEIVVVEGAYSLPALDGVRLVRSSDWQEGPGASLRSGLAALDETSEAAVVVLADGPRLSPAAVERVIAAWRAGSDPVVAASYDGSRGHPLVVARDAYDEIPAEGLRGRPVRLVPCDDLGDPGDIDYRADLEADPDLGLGR